ncbi:MAG: Small-conductance mechanosensitive ion channel-like protein [Parcubacteria group bacterium GW2011_GWA2_50_10b]|nr:MAG: Small-conductance mechanosensitive ion channel-like protein [Parcubacteria group bacterium GW2011_GWA2_50_10b]
MLLNTWGEVLTLSFQNLWVGVVNFVPNLVIALVILILGWLVGALLGRAIAQVFRSLKVDEALRHAGFESVVRRGGMNLDSGAFIGGLVKWFVIVIFLVAAFDVLGLSQVNLFLQEVVLAYLPRVIVGALVILVAGVIGDVIERVVVTAAKSAGVRSAHFAGAVAKWAVWVFGILVALSQLGIATAFSQTLFTGIVVAISLALGLSFGLGGQEQAARFLERLRADMSGKNQ